MPIPQGKSRTLSIRLDNLDKSRLTKTDKGHVYLNLQTWDYDEPGQYGDHFSVSLPLNDAEKALKEKGEKKYTTYVGSGKVWEPNTRPLTPEEQQDLPF